MSIYSNILRSKIWKSTSRKWWSSTMNLKFIAIIRVILESLKYNWKSQNFNSKSSWNYEMNPEKILLLITWNKICINLLWDSSGTYVKMNHFLKILHFFSLFHVIYHCFKDNFTVKNNQITYLKCYRFELINLWSI